MILSPHSMVRTPQSTSSTASDSPAESPPLSSNWRANRNELLAQTCLGDADNSLFDMPIPSHLDDEYPFMSHRFHGFEFDVEAWPCSEPPIKDETIFPFDDILESEIAANQKPSCPLNTAYPMWEDSRINYITVPKMEQDRSIDCTLSSEAVGLSPRSVGSMESDQGHCNPRGRKSPLEVDFFPSDESVSQPSKGTKRKRNDPFKAAAHNMIEKKYRSNLNDKMIALRDSIPSLRTAADSTADSADGKESSRKLNKAYILTEARDYIRYLKKRNKVLINKEKDLEAQIKAFQMLSRSRYGKGNWAI